MSSTSHTEGFKMICKNGEYKEEYKADALAIFWILIIFYAFACVRERKKVHFLSHMFYYQFFVVAIAHQNNKT